jgi:aspartyl-tRNA(Asn)/glutamyl-tRNA(Gln) amidotransferase subunit A
VTDSPLTGITRNPWDETRTPGGSSGGAAAAALCGFGPLHIGTDGGGSVRIPSAFSGIVAIKAHFGRVPTYPPSPFGTLSHLGPMARSVADAALMLTVMAGPDSRDAHALPYDGHDYSRVLEGGVSGLRIAYSADLGYAEVDPEIAALVARAVETFSALGATVETIDPGFANPNEIFRTTWHAGTAQIVRKMTPEQRAVLDPGLLVLAERGEAITMEAFMDAAAARDRLTAHMRAFHETYDLLLTPTMPTPAFSLGPESPIGDHGREWDRWSPFTYPFNLTGQPAATVPCGFTEAGLPAGLQIVGRAYDESMVLRAARAFENAHPEHFRVPEITM